MPVVIYLIFFTIELIKINITQDALQSICEEATYLTIAHDFDSYSNWVEKIDAIIEKKYRPTFISGKAQGYSSTPYPVIRYEILFYNNFEEILSAVPYGGHSVRYPAYETDRGASKHWSFGPSGEIIPTNGMEYNGFARQFNIGLQWDDEQKDPANCIFVITFSCNYPFSNSLVKWLFNRGVNTEKTTRGTGYNGKSTGIKGTMYILWARGAGIVNAK